ncbi:class I SAM-dependent methyltransferase [soil metagenome]
MFNERVRRVIEEVNRLRDQVDDHYQIPADEALVLAQLVRIGRCVSICEVGTSYGFSTLHFAAVAREQGGRVHSIDNEPHKVEAARQHLEAAGLLDAVTFHLGDARDILPALTPAKPFDFVFLDAIKEQCREYLDALGTKLAPTCTIATDNTRTHPEELAPFVSYLRSISWLASCEVAVGNGFELTVLRA